MFSARIRLFSLLGFRVSLDASWFFLAFYLVLSLSTRYFPAYVPHQGWNVYLFMGIVGAFGLFSSIVLHELAHAVVARSFGLPIGGITLFIFGGVAELRQEPKNPRSEFWVAIAGPIASIAIAGACYAAGAGAQEAGLGAIAPVLAFLTMTNTVLALFNLVPAFPLDGGRILRSIIWWRTGNLKRATHVAALCGSIFAIVLIALGLFQIVSGNAMAGTWQLLIGIFLAAAASQARVQTHSIENLRGVSVADLMRQDSQTVGPDITVDRVVRDYMYRLNRKFVVVADGEHAIGYIGPEQIRKIHQSDWPDTYARAAAARFTHETAVSPQTSAIEALRKLQSNGIGYAAVLEGNRPIGVLSETDFINYLSVREELARPPAARGDRKPLRR